MGNSIWFMEDNRKIIYLRDIKTQIDELIHQGLNNKYSETFRQVNEMNIYLRRAYSNNDLILKELELQPILPKPSFLNENIDAYLTVGYLGALAPFLFYLFLILTFPLTGFFLFIRWQNKNKVIEHLRQFENHLTRLIIEIKSNPNTASAQSS